MPRSEPGNNSSRAFAHPEPAWPGLLLRAPQGTLHARTCPLEGTREEKGGSGLEGGQAPLSSLRQL